MSDKQKFNIGGFATPRQAFDLAMRRNLFYFAAQIARDYGLGNDLVLDAAFKAYCRFDDQGLDVCKALLLKEFGLTEGVIVLGERGLFHASDRGFPPIFVSSEGDKKRPLN